MTEQPAGASTRMSSHSTSSIGMFPSVRPPPSPNEACLVIEDGRIIGTSTQTDLVVNPEVGALGPTFGKGPAKRAFLFVLLGLKDLHFTIKGRTKDGMEVRAPRGTEGRVHHPATGPVAQPPRQGYDDPVTGALAERLQPQMTPIVVNEVMGLIHLGRIAIRRHGGIQCSFPSVLRCGPP